MICRAVDLCDPDVRKDMYSNIIVAGGNTLLRDFTLRLPKVRRDSSICPHVFFFSI